MTLLSVPLSADLENFVVSMVKRGAAASKADVVRKALRLLEEEEEMNTVLKAEQDLREGKGFEGDLRERAKPLS